MPDNQYLAKYQPCVSLDCNSSDGLSVYADDGHAYCFVCETHWTAGQYAIAKMEKQEENGGDDLSFISKPSKPSKPSSPLGGEISEIKSRCISLPTAKKFNVRITKDANQNDTHHYYPYYDGEREVIKTRDVLAKKNKEGRAFYWSDGASSVHFFGKQLFEGGQKYVTLCEGEIDTMSAYQMLNEGGTNYAVLGIKSSSEAERAVRDNLEYLYSFEHVVLCFDMDEPGRKATEKIARLLKTGKTKIMSLPSGFNDVNEMLMAGEKEAWKKSWWNAKTYTPSGLVSVSDSKARYLERPEKLSVPFPWRGLNEKLEGFRQGEILVLAAGTGLGKSAVCREWQHWLLQQTQDNIGIIMLEESYERTIDGLMSIQANERLSKHSIRETFDTERLSEWHDALFEGANKNRVWVYEHVGENNLTAIADRVKFMAAGSECKWIFIDHIHMISAAGGDNETAEINKIMHKFRDLCEELNIAIITVSHLRRLDGNKGHENGAEVNLSHLRGSHVIAQIADAVLALERNQQAEDEQEARTTRLRILKNRYTGEVGESGFIEYDPVTGRLHECDDRELELVTDQEVFT